MSFNQQILMPLELLVWFSAFYFTHYILIVISLIPAVIRAAQMLNNKYLSSHALEAMAGTSRAVLVLAIIGVGTNAGIVSLLSGQVLSESFYQCFLWVRVAWPSIILHLVFFGLLFGLINLLVWLGVRKASGAEGIQSSAGNNSRRDKIGNAIVFIVKNALIIPIGMVYLLRVFRLI